MNDPVARKILPRIFDRLVGLETEYAIRFRPADSFAPTSKFQLYKSLVASLKARVPLVRAKHFKEGVFTASGGAVWFETERIASNGGLIEGSTPECRGVRQLLTYQRAQDAALSAAAEAAQPSAAFALVKNCRDSRDNVYGAQENYEAKIGDGIPLLVWRVGLVLLSPLVLLTWLCLLAMIVGVFLYLALAGLVYLPLQMLGRGNQRIALFLFGRDLVEGTETGGPLPPWLEWCMLWTARVTSAPLAFALLTLTQLTAFREPRKHLLAFLVSRPVFAGAGYIDRQGNFGLAEKAPAINCSVGFGGYLWDRPIFNFGHFFKALSIEALMMPRDYVTLFSDVQRLQIGLGDSNMAETAELLRIGTTLLVLDAIEAGVPTDDLPRLRRPIRALHQICQDASLIQKVRLVDGREMTALEIQRCYYEFCQHFLMHRPDAPAEAFELLDAWGDVLETLDSDPASLVGTLDWVTKKYLLDQAGDTAAIEQRKKIAIRYHELSAEGYFQRLAETGVIKRWLDPLEIERATRIAPPDSPATTRGRYIREFDDGTEPLTANWRRIVIGRGRGSKTIHLGRYGKFRRRTNVPKHSDN